MRKQLLKRKLILLKTYVKPIQCAMMSDIVAKECKRYFHQYISVYYGKFSSNIKTSQFVNKVELEGQLAEDLDKVKNFHMHEAYNTYGMDYGMEKDLKFYLRLHILVLGISEEHLETGSYERY